MDKNQFDAYVKSRFENQVEWYDTKSIHNQKVYKNLQWAIIICSSITPLLIALDFGFSEYVLLKWLSVATAVIVGIAAVSQRSFKYYDNWINYRTNCESLKKEKYLHDTGVGDYAEITDKDAFFVERIESLISKENTIWINTFQKKT